MKRQQLCVGRNGLITGDEIDWSAVVRSLHRAPAPDPLPDGGHRQWMEQHAHAHAFAEIVICLSGEHIYGVGDGAVVLRPGGLYIFPPRCRHDSCYGPHHVRCVDLWMHLLPSRGTVTLNLVEHDPVGATALRPLPMPGVEILRDAARLIELIGDGDSSPPSAEEAGFFALYLGARICRGLAESRLERTPHDQLAVIRQIKEYISGNLCDDLHLDQLARVAGYSPFYFHRIFQRLEGVTVRCFVESERLQSAQQLLSKGHSITAAALASGFESPSQFARVFKRRMGRSASSWLEKQEMHSRGKK